MNQTAVFSETTYHLLEVIPGLDGGSYVLCESEAGHRFICPMDRWEVAAPPKTKMLMFSSSSPNRFRLLMRETEKLSADQGYG